MEWYCPWPLAVKKVRRRPVSPQMHAFYGLKLEKYFMKKMSDVHKFFHNYFQKIYGFYCTVCMIWSNISQKMCTRHFLCVVLCVWCKSMVFDLLCIVDFFQTVACCMSYIYFACQVHTWSIFFLDFLCT